MLYSAARLRLVHPPRLVAELLVVLTTLCTSALRYHGCTDLVVLTTLHLVVLTALCAKILTIL